MNQLPQRKYPIQFLSLILSLALIFSLISLPIRVFAADNISIQKQPQLPAVAEKHKKFPATPTKGQKVEIPEWRSAKVKHFLKDDGSFVAEVSKESMFYSDLKSKKLLPIDNNLVSSSKKGYGYENKANRFKIHFPHELTPSTKTRFEIGESSIELFLENALSSKGTIDKNQMTYKGVFNQTDIRYTIESDQLKEDIILNHKDAPTSFTYQLNLENLTYESMEDGTIEFRYKDTQQFAFVFPKPFMYENGEAPEVSNAVKQSIRKEGDKLYLDIIADPDWINVENRKFPVIIDPSINSEQVKMDDTFVSSNYPTTDYSGLDHVYAGSHNTYGKTEAYLKFPLPSLPDGANISKVQAKIYNYLSNTSTTNLEVYRINNWWTESATNWNNKPEKGQLEETYASSSGGWHYLDLTTLGYDWYTGRERNNGIAIVANPDISEPVGYTSSNHSSNDYRPKLMIEYEIDPEGINDFWTYTADGVMPFKGNLFLNATDLLTDGRGIDAVLSRSYHSRHHQKSGYFGQGWYSNLDMRVYDLIGSIAFVDATGTRHIFKKDHQTGTYSPPAGINLSLIRDSVNKEFRITTTENEILYFDWYSGELTAVENASQQKTTFTKSGNQILITDPSGRITTIYLRTDGKVDYATDPKGRKVQYSFNPSGLLNGVNLTYETESHSTFYTYKTGTTLLETATDPEGNIVTYIYDQWNRVNQVNRQIDGKPSLTTYSIDSAASPRMTTVNGPNGEQTIYYYNDQGNVTKTIEKLNDTETAETSYSWNVYNYLYQIDAPNNQTTKIEYGNNGKPTKITTPDNQDVRFNYDVDNNLITSKDKLNYVNGSDYDQNHNQTDITDATGTTTMLDYETNGNLKSITDAMSLAENYIYNSGFEYVSNNKPVGWSENRSLISGEILEASTSTKKTGFHALHLKSNSSSGLYGVQKYQIPVTPNMTYRLSGDMKLGSNSTVEFKIAWYDENGQLISELNGLSSSQAGSWGTDWHFKSTGVKAPSNAKKAKIQVGLIGVGEAWFDSIMFEGGTGRSGNLLIANYSFDYDNDQTSLADEWKTSIENTGISIDYSEKKHGIASEKITGGSTYKYVIQHLNMAGKKGTKFNLSGWGKPKNVPSTGGEWGLKLELTDTSGNATYIYVPFNRSITNWQQISRVIEAPIDFVQVGIAAVVNSMPTTTEAWFDEVKLSVLDIPSSSISKYNYVDNSSFEYDYDQSNWPDGWYRSSGNGQLTGKWVDLNTSNGNVYTGSHALMISNPTSWESATRTGEKIPFNSKSVYTAVGYIKTIDVTSSSVIIVHAYDQYGSWLGEVPSQSISGTQDWKRVSVVVDSSKVPSGTAQLAVGVQMRAGSGTTYFDNIRLQEGNLHQSFNYDTKGNYVTEVISPTGNKVSMTRESTTGNIQSLIDAKGNQYVYQYNMNDQITFMTFPMTGKTGAVPVNKTIQYQYDKNGNLKSFVDPNGLSWLTFQYNELNQVSNMTEIVTWNGQKYYNPTSYNYDTSGRLTEAILPEGQYMAKDYDLAGRLKQLTFGKNSTASTTFSYQYDQNGNLKSYGSGASQSSIQYDPMNRPKKETESKTTNYIDHAYDEEGRRTELKVTNVSNEWTYGYSYDGKGHPAEFTDSTGKVANYLFDESSRKVKTWYGNNTSAFYEYDQEGRIKQLRNEVAGGVYNKFRYDYDANGNVTKIWSDMDSSWIEYTYDTLNLLLEEKYSNGTTIQYEYDELGNRIKVTKNGVATTYTYNPEKNRLVSMGNRNYSYDANGNILGDGKYTYFWGDNNKLKEVKQGSTTVASYQYDALGRRTQATVNGVTKTFHYDGNQVTYVEQSDGKLYRFAYDHGGKPVLMGYNNQVYWYHYDKHGNVIHLSDNAGNTVASYQYDAWGNITSQKDHTGAGIDKLNPYRYVGYWYDAEISKYYLNARYYDAEVGRFLAKDPIAVLQGNPTGLNSYTYAGNNPVMFIDETGLMSMREDENGKLVRDDYYDDYYKNSNQVNNIVFVYGNNSNIYNSSNFKNIVEKEKKKFKEKFPNNPNVIFDETVKGSLQGAIAGAVYGEVINISKKGGKIKMDTMSSATFVGAHIGAFIGFHNGLVRYGFGKFLDELLWVDNPTIYRKD